MGSERTSYSLSCCSRTSVAFRLSFWISRVSWVKARADVSSEGSAESSESRDDDSNDNDGDNDVARFHGWDTDLGGGDSAGNANAPQWPVHEGCWRLEVGVPFRLARDILGDLDWESLQPNIFTVPAQHLWLVPLSRHWIYADCIWQGLEDYVLRRPSLAAHASQTYSF